MQFSCQYDASVSMIKPRICLKLALVAIFHYRNVFPKLLLVDFGAEPNSNS